MKIIIRKLVVENVGSTGVGILSKAAVDELAAWAGQAASKGVADKALDKISRAAADLGNHPAVAGNYRLSQGMASLAAGAMTVLGLYYLVQDLTAISSDPSIQNAEWNDFVRDLLGAASITIAESGPGLPPSYWGVEKCEQLSGYGTRISCEKYYRKKGITKDPADLKRARDLARRAEAGEKGAGSFSSFIDDITPSAEFVGRNLFEDQISALVEEELCNKKDK